MPGDAGRRRSRRGHPAQLGFLIAAALLQGAAPSAARVDSVSVVFWPGQERRARELAALAAQPVDWPGLGIRSVGPLKLIVVPDAATLARELGGRVPSWSAGVTVPAANTILIRTDLADAERTLRHELGHLVLHRAVAGRVPRWFDEGYATWGAGEWARLVDLELNVAVVRGRVPSLDEVDAALVRGPVEAGAAYALAATAVVELARRSPTGSLGPLLTRLGEGVAFPDAVLQTTGLPLDRFEIAWRASVRRRYTVATWIVAGGGWLALAVLLLIAVRLRRRRDAARRAALDHGWVVEESPPELDPPTSP